MPKNLSDKQFLEDAQALLELHRRAVESGGRDAKEERPAVAHTIKRLEAAMPEREAISRKLAAIIDELNNL